MTISMIASKRFRLAQEKGFAWVNPSQPYDVPDAKTADFHEDTGRGKRAEPTEHTKAVKAAEKKGA